MRKYIEATENVTMGQLVNRFNQVVAGSEVIKSNSLTAVLVLSSVTFLIALFSLMVPEAGKNGLLI